MPKVGTHAIIVNESNHVLLVRKNYLAHDWIPPGGMMEDGESISTAVAREVLEETGYVIEPMKPEAKKLLALFRSGHRGLILNVIS